MVAVALAIGGALVGLRGRGARLLGSRETAAAPISFEDVTTAAGIRFAHHNGAFGKKYMPETVGSGVAFLDYDGDGWLDLLYIDSSSWPERPSLKTTHPVLYRNMGDGTFTDLTRRAGLEFQQYGMGVAAGDFDNDGLTDLYFTALGPNRLFRNRGDGTFENVTARAGVAGMNVQPGGVKWKWSTSASWVDYDRDGRLDLMVLNYVKWMPENDVWCGEPQAKGYCPPVTYEGLPMSLYRNLGNGHFVDVSRITGISKALGKGFGIATADYDGDGWTDVAVANDTEANLLFMNRGGRAFDERGVESGIALAESGRARAGMGVDCGDWRNDGRFGLLIGNFAREGLALYANYGGTGTPSLREEAHKAGLGDSSLMSLTFGAFFFDFDNDGWLDAFAANGHIDDFVNSRDSQITYEQRPLVYRNTGDGGFSEMGTRMGPAMQTRIVARGAAAGDVDNDGDPDVALVWNGRKGLLWRNDGGNRNNWIGILLEGRRSNRDGIGAVVHVRAGGITRTATRKSGGSFLSESQPRLLFGLGDNTQADVEVRWPSGEVTRLPRLGSRHYYRLIEGRATASPGLPEAPRH
jgi:hypothetical protein